MPQVYQVILKIQCLFSPVVKKKIGKLGALNFHVHLNFVLKYKQRNKKGST